MERIGQLLVKAISPVSERSVAYYLMNILGGYLKKIMKNLAVDLIAYYICSSSFHIAYQERLREMARRSLDNLPRFTNGIRCQLHPAEGGTDKSD